MLRPWRRLAIAAALHLTLGVGAAAAQNVVVTNAPPKAPVELVLNLAPIASGTTDAAGDATLAINLSATLKKQAADLGVFVDSCGNLRRILLAERGVQPPAAATDCTRQEVPGMFVVQAVTSLLIDLAGDRPAVWLKQGPVPKEWLLKGAQSEEEAARVWRPLPVGVVLFGGGGLATFGDTATLSCGNVEGCESDDTRLTFAAGGDWWINRFLAAEVSYIRPGAVTASGSGATYRFDSSLETELFTIAGKLGIPAGPVRIYGKGGLVYHRATSTTRQSFDDLTVTDESGEVTYPGGTQEWEVKTRGWSWMVGGGIEAWVSRRLALYAEGDYLRVRGDAVQADEPALQEKAAGLLFGIRLYLGR